MIRIILINGDQIRARADYIEVQESLTFQGQRVIEVFSVVHNQRITIVIKNILYIEEIK